MGTTSEPILNALKNDCDISAFSGPQILEEKIKAHLLLKSQSWAEAIYEIEKHSYFNGQVGFIFNFTEILFFYQDHKHCDWSEEQDEQYFRRFEKYAKASGATFSIIDKSSSAINYFWERAVLSKGVYFTSSTANRFNLLSTRLTKNNIERDHSWRRLLRISSNSDWEARQGYVKAVFDDPLFDNANVAASLERICIDALDDSDMEDWREAFIKYKEVFCQCNQGFVSINDQEFILLGESQRNHHHSELYTKVLELELSKEMDQLQPFTGVSYQFVKSRNDYAGVNIGGWHFNENDYSLFIGYDSNNFVLWFEGSLNHSDAIVEVLTCQGFEPKECDLSGLNANERFVNDKLNKINDVRVKIINVCSDLRGLVHK